MKTVKGSTTHDTCVSYGLHHQSLLSLQAHVNFLHNWAYLSKLKNCANYEKKSWWIHIHGKSLMCPSFSFRGINLNLPSMWQNVMNKGKRETCSVVPHQNCSVSFESFFNKILSWKLFYALKTKVFVNNNEKGQNRDYVEKFMKHIRRLSQ